VDITSALSDRPLASLAIGVIEKAILPVVINGSPTHALIVHAVVVLVPLSALAALGLVFVPASRRAFGLVSVGVAFVGCVAIPLSFWSGSALRHRVAPSPLIDHHVALAHQLLVIAAVFGLSLAAFVVVDIVRRSRSGELNQVEAAVVARQPGLLDRPSESGLQLLHRVTAVVLVAMSLLTAFAVVRVGDSGAKAVWHDRLSNQRLSGTTLPRAGGRG
jgi:hypothetical protein